jgi:membrane protease YdiL (CAAX protease family)
MTGEPQRSKRIAATAILLIVVINLGASLLSRQVGEDGRGGSLAALAGVVLCLAVVWVAQRKLGLGLGEIGLRRPDSWPRTIGQGALVTVVGYAASFAVLMLIIVPLSGQQPDVSRFDSTRGNLGVMIGTVLTVWITSAFPEEVIWRGFLMTRIGKLAGATRFAWGTALVVTSVHFGMIHFYQGVSGMVTTGVVGFVYGAAYLLFKRNLWVTIVAHALTHVLSFTLLYLGAF